MQKIFIYIIKYSDPDIRNKVLCKKVHAEMKLFPSCNLTVIGRENTKTRFLPFI